MKAHTPPARIERSTAQLKHRQSLYGDPELAGHKPTNRAHIVRVIESDLNLYLAGQRAQRRPRAILSTAAPALSKPLGIVSQTVTTRHAQDQPEEECRLEGTERRHHELGTAPGFHDQLSIWDVSFTWGSGQQIVAKKPSTAALFRGAPPVQED
jgi:hypothetical protein